MSEIARLLEANRLYAGAHAPLDQARPSRGLAIVTCMDARIDVFTALGLELGEAHVIRNAGGRLTDDVLRSLTVSTHVGGATTVVMMQHTQCAMAQRTDEELRACTGAALDFFAIDDHHEALRHDVGTLSSVPFLANVTLIVGFLYDIETGEIHEVLRRER